MKQLKAAGVFASMSLLCTPCAAQAGRSAENNAARDEITELVDLAATAGIEALVSVQSDNGSFGEARYANSVAVTSLAGIALMADGSTPTSGPHAERVSRALDFVLTNTTESGLVASEAANGPMYGHGFATLFLGEAYGMTAGGADTARAERLYEGLVKAVRLIERTQNDEGGWRYDPKPQDADVSVTICQIMALRSARNAGLEVDAAVIDRAVEYVRKCQNADGGFRYQLHTTESAWPRTAAGVASLFYAGIYEDESIDAGLEYLNATAMPGRAQSQRAHYFYGHYYAVQAMYLAGGDYWAEWWPAIRQELIETQDPSGFWNDRGVGRSYGTAMALIILQMPKRYLPIFQK